MATIRLLSIIRDTNTVKTVVKSMGKQTELKRTFKKHIFDLKKLFSRSEVAYNLKRYKIVYK